MTIAEIRSKISELHGGGVKLDTTIVKETGLQACVRPAFDEAGVLSTNGIMLNLGGEREVYVAYSNPALEQVLEAGLVRSEQLVTIDDRLVLTSGEGSSRTFSSKG